MTSLPPTARPPSTALIAVPPVTVAMITRPRPSDQLRRGIGRLAIDVVLRAELPGQRCLSPPRAMATVSKPIFDANWMPKWPCPPTPNTATVSPGRAPLWCRALNVGTPAQHERRPLNGRQPVRD
jgi:hypothetical protein